MQTGIKHKQNTEIRASLSQAKFVSFCLHMSNTHVWYIIRRLSIIFRNKWTWSKGEMRHNRRTFNLTGWIVALASFAEGHEITILKHHNII